MYIQCIVYSNYNPGHEIDRLIPDGTANLIIELGDVPQYIFDNKNLTRKSTYKGAWVSGMQTEFISISSANNGMLVVQFHPSGAFPILHLPINELQNQVVDADIVLGNSIYELREQLMEEHHIDKKIQLVENWLLQRLKDQSTPESVIQYAVALTIQYPSELSISEIKNKIGYSHRHFIQLFKKHVGLSPKQYQRIVRFNKVLESINNGENISWPQLSLSCGYYDQAHFIKEFKEFSGLNPKEYLYEKGEYANYVPVSGFET